MGILLSPGLVMGMSLTAYADDPVPVTDIDFTTYDDRTLLVEGGNPVQITNVTIKPDNATDPTVKWSSSDPTVATVTETQYGNYTVKEVTGVLYLLSG